MRHRMLAPWTRSTSPQPRSRTVRPLARVTQRVMQRVPRWPATTLTAAAMLWTTAACRSFNNGNDQPLHPLTIEVKNNLTEPTQITVYILSEGGYRQILGDVGPSDSRTFAFTPRSYTETYRLVAQIPLARPFRSQPFTVGSEMTGWIQWTMIPNIIGFWDREEDTVVVPDSTPHDSAGTMTSDTTKK